MRLEGDKQWKYPHTKNNWGDWFVNILKVQSGKQEQSSWGRCSTEKWVCTVQTIVYNNNYKASICQIIIKQILKIRPAFIHHTIHIITWNTFSFNFISITGFFLLHFKCQQSGQNDQKGEGTKYILYSMQIYYNGITVHVAMLQT